MLDKACRVINRYLGRVKEGRGCQTVKEIKSDGMNLPFARPLGVYLIRMSTHFRLDVDLS